MFVFWELCLLMTKLDNVKTASTAINATISFFILICCPLYTIGTSVLILITCYCRPVRNAHKKSVEPSSSSVFMRSWTTYQFQLQRTSPRLRRNAVAWSGEHLKSVEVFRKPDKLLRFFLFCAVHTKLCAMLHRQMYSLIIPFMMV